MTNTFSTNLRCGACEKKIAPAFDAEPGIDSWSLDLASPEKPLTVHGNITPAKVKALLNAQGYDILAEQPPEPKTSYFPLLLIVAYILAAVAAFEIAAGTLDIMRAMRHFMAGFFLVFSFFKLLDLRGFAESFAMYDLLAARSRAYAYAYPFVELGLGLAYLANLSPMVVNAATLAIMLLGTAGILNTFRQRRRVKCACLGTVFNLPMSTVTLVEDLSMTAMAAVMLLM